MKPLAFFPLTPMQQGMQYQWRLAPTSGVNLEQMIIHCDHALDTDRMKNACALREDRGDYTYDELNRRTNRLAHAPREHDLMSGHVACIAMERPQHPHHHHQRQSRGTAGRPPHEHAGPSLEQRHDSRRVGSRIPPLTQEHP